MILIWKIIIETQYQNDFLPDVTYKDIWWHSKFSNKSNFLHLTKANLSEA